jgi:hypothetical protein
MQQQTKRCFLRRAAPRTLLRSAEVIMFLLLGDRGKRLYCARVGRGHVTSAVPQWRHAAVEALLEAVLPSARLRVYRTDWSLFRESSRREVRSRRRPERVNWRTMWAVVSWVRENNSGSENSAFQVSSRRELWRMLLWREDLCVIFGVWDCGIFFVLRSVARRRVVKTGNPSTSATVNWKVCKREIALYCLCVSIIKSECLTKC